MANPQVEKGYTRIANELFEKIIFANFTASEYKIIFTVIRFSYGFQRKCASASLDALASACNIHRVTVSKVINKLIKNGVLIEVSPPGILNSRKVAINKDYDNWFTYMLTVSPQTTGCSQTNQRVARRLPNGLPTGNPTYNKEIYKEIYKERKKTTYDDILSEIADDSLRETYLEYIKMRKMIKSPMTDRALTMLIKKVNELEPASIDRQKQLLETAIMNNWKSVYPLKEDKPSKNSINDAISKRNAVDREVVERLMRSIDNPPVTAAEDPELQARVEALKNKLQGEEKQCQKLV